MYAILLFIGKCVLGFCAGWGIADILQCIFSDHEV